MTNKDNEFLAKLKETGEYWTFRGASEELNNTINFFIQGMKNAHDKEIKVLKKKIRRFKAEVAEYMEQSSNKTELINALVSNMEMESHS